MSNLLSQASLVMIPSGYKEDIVYSPIPTNGNGDLSFTRASNGTRVNSAGLVEVCPWNLVQQSETFDNVAWNKTNSTVTANDTTAPNGTLTADKIDFSGSSSYVYQATVGTNSTTGCLSVYLKANANTQIYIASNDLVAFGTGIQLLCNVTTEWQRFEIGGVASNVDGFKSWLIGTTTTGSGGLSARTIFVWGAQLNIGSTAKPYFPTTDRLNVPRLTYQNGGGGCPSLLLEKQSTNVVTYSEDFSNAVYTKRNSTIGSNVTTSPDGTTNADKIQEDTSNNRHDIYTGFTCTNGVTYTQTIFAKQGERRYCFMSFGTAIINAGDCFFDLQDGVVVSSPSGVTSSIENMGNGWYRCRITATCSADGTGYFVNGPANTSSNYIYQGVSGYGIYIYGVQIEASSYPTSYIPTTSSSATRVADACSKTGISSLIGQTEGTLFVDVVTPTAIPSGTEILPISIFPSGGGTGGTQTYISFLSNGVVRFVYFDGAIQALITSASGFWSAGNRYKLAAVYKQNDFAFYINGVQIGVDNSGNVSAMADFYLDYQGMLEQNTVNQVALFPTRLTNAELASLTTI